MVAILPNTEPVRSPLPGSAPTIGVEEEFILVHPHTGTPFLGNTEVAKVGRTLGADLQLELSRCQIETATRPCAHLTDLGREVRRARAAAADAAAKAGARLLAVAVPPAGPPPQAITDAPRYRLMADRFGALAEQVICGAHVHVCVPNREVAAAVSNHLRPWLPVLLALTANSPISAGRDTGYASWRHILWSRWPSAGPPPYFRSAQHYDSLVARMLENESILDTAMIYWDIRLSAHLPTIEVRIADVPATAGEAVLLAALIRGLVGTALTDIRRGAPAPMLDQQVLRSAYWRAAHDGMTGHGIDALSGRLVPAGGLLERLLTRIRPALEEHGDYTAARAAVTRVLATGNGAARQRRALRAGSLATVLDLLTHTTTEGC